MKTLDQLVKELNLKPSSAEVRDGRSKTRNGYSYVHINNRNEYVTYIYKDIFFDYKSCILVRG